MTSASDNPRVHHGAYGTCRDPTNRLLLVHLASGLDKGQWALPGGEIEWGEHPDAALLRKMEEETGLVDIDSFRVTTVYSHTYRWSAQRPYNSIHHIGIVYEVCLEKFDLRPEENGSTDRSEWFTEEGARKLPLTPMGECAVDLVWPQS